MSYSIINSTCKTLQESQAQINAVVEAFFDTGHLKGNLKERSVRGGMATMFSMGRVLCIRTGSTIVLARLLTPQDYGLIAMVTAITNFVMIFRDMGLSTATVQKAELNHSQVSTLFWINVVTGLGLTLLMAASGTSYSMVLWRVTADVDYSDARWGVSIYGSDDSASGLVEKANAVRHVSCGRDYLPGGRVGTAIVAADYGAGYWALVLMQLAIPVSNVIGVWIACELASRLANTKVGDSFYGALWFKYNRLQYNQLFLRELRPDSNRSLLRLWCPRSVQ